MARDRGQGLSNCTWLALYTVLKNDCHEAAALECSLALGALTRLGRVLSREELSVPVRALSMHTVPLRGTCLPLSRTTKGTRSSVTLAFFEVTSGSSSQPCKLLSPPPQANFTSCNLERSGLQWGGQEKPVEVLGCQDSNSGLWLCSIEQVIRSLSLCFPLCEMTAVSVLDMLQG